MNARRGVVWDPEPARLCCLTFHKTGERHGAGCARDKASEPPVTADHAPERLSAEEREQGLMSAGVRWFHERDVERILAAHLADAEARLAAVEAEVTGAGCMCRGAHYVCVKHRVLSALHPGHGEPR